MSAEHLIIMDDNNNNHDNPKFALGTKFWKVFEGYDEPFQGTITSFEGGYYHGVYEDGDEEDYTEQEMKGMIQTGKQEPAAIPEQNTNAEQSQKPFAVGTKFWKLFDGYDETFQGTITSFKDGYYHGVYEDGDEEDYTEQEMEGMIQTEKQEPAAVPEQNTNVQKSEPFAVGTKFWKLFDSYDEAFQGTITSFEGGYYHGVYDDGDEEDYSENEMEAMIKAGKPKKKKKKRNQQQDVTPQAAVKTTIVSSRSGRKIQQVSYDLNALDENEFTESDSDNNDSSDEDNSVPAKKKSRRASTNTATTASAKKIQQQAVTPPSVAKGRAIDFDAYNGNFMPDGENTVVNGKDGKQPRKESSHGKGMVSSFQNIISVPVFPDKSLSDIDDFLDSRGLDVTDNGIVDRLVGDQVSRLGGLLCRALSYPDNNNNNKGVAVMGTQENPLTLGTACTGTDAPALALAMVQEQMKARLGGLLTINAATSGFATVTGDDAMGTGTKPATAEAAPASVPKLYFSHEFSCENDPFKQAFLERNSKSIIYPGIKELYGDAESKQPPLPKVTLFVARANCQNDFSMSRATQQLDMEKRGHSGDSFMATVEVILQKQPQFCVLEIEGDLKGSWHKMQQYVTGRVPLSDCDYEKANGTAKSQVKDMLFSFDEDSQNIVVEEVPSFCGVQCGATVAGYMQGIEGTIHPLLWPQDKGKGDTCILSELVAANKIEKKMGTLVLDRAVAYFAKMCKLDTQHFGLPQTRERTYMFVWQSLQQPQRGHFDTDDLGDYWEGVVKYLKTPLRYSLDAFVLESDHPIVRAFRESLAGVADNEAKLKIDVPPHYWLEYLNCQRES